MPFFNSKKKIVTKKKKLGKFLPKVKLGNNLSSSLNYTITLTKREIGLRLEQLKRQHELKNGRSVSWADFLEEKLLGSGEVGRKKDMGNSKAKGN